MGEILVIKLSALGDLVQADGALRDIREYHRGDRVTVMTTPAYHRYFERCPWVDDILIDPRAPRYHIAEMGKLRSRLQEKSYDRVYDLQQVGRTRFYYRYLFPDVWWMGDARGCSCYLKRADTSCAVDHFKRHLDHARVPANHTLRSDVSWMADDVDQILAAHGVEPGYALLIPGASATHRDKCWSGFTELAQTLQARGVHPVTVPGPGEIEQYRAVPGTTLLAGDGCLDYFALAGVAQKARFVVGNDTGPTHIAAHLGCRGLALYGSHTSARSTGIQHTGFRWLEVADLSTLSIATVWQVVESELMPEAGRTPLL